MKTWTLPLGAVLFGAWLPVAVLLFPVLQERVIDIFMPGMAPLTWPVWIVGERPQVVFDPVEICAAIIYIISILAFVRFVRGNPATRLYWFFWVPLLLSALALFIMGRPHTCLASLAGLALLGRCNDSKFHRTLLAGETTGF